jgi:hypothetical protein
MKNVLIERMGTRDDYRTTGPDGSFFFPDIPRTQPSQFRVRVEAEPGKRPLTKPDHRFVFDPDQAQYSESLAEADVTWEIPVYRWLILGVSAELDEFKRIARAHYPIYVLEKHDVSGQTWRGVSGDHFIDTAEGLAVSVTSPGTYRIAVVLTPTNIINSRSAVITESDTEVSTFLLDFPSDQPEYYVFVTDRDRRAPIPNAQVTVIGPHTSIPPVPILTDTQGIADIGPISVDRVHVIVETREVEQETVVHRDDIKGTEIPIEISLKNNGKGFELKMP